MAFEYDPKDAENTFPPGEYDAVLVKAEDSVSKSSNQPMLVVTFRVYNGSETMDINEYVVKKTTFKLKRIAQALGKEKEFDTGTFQCCDNLNESLRVELGVQSQEGFDDRNVIEKFLPPQGGFVAPKAAASGGGHDALTEDDIPF